MSSTNSSSSSTESEVTPLVAAPTSAAAENTATNGNFYFLTRNESTKSASSKTNVPGDEGLVVEKLPYGATEEEFASRPVVVSEFVRTDSIHGFSLSPSKWGKSLMYISVFLL